MPDSLFGDPEPEQAGPAQFDRFWSVWPGNGSRGFEDYTRKKDKKKCLELWKKQRLDRQADEIIRDVEQRSRYDKGWRGNRGAFLCAPLVYLRNERWTDGEYADIRDQKSPHNKGAEPGLDPNKVVEWIKANIRLTESQLTGPWQWIWDGERLTGVKIPDRSALMLKDMR